MTDEIAKTAEADETVILSIPDAMREAAATAPEHGTRVKQAASAAGPEALETISQMFYTGSYVFAYDIAHATVFVAQSLPQDSPIMRGFRDGGNAAVEELDAA